MSRREHRPRAHWLLGGPPSSHLRRTSSGARVCPSSSVKVGTSKKKTLLPSVPRAARSPAASSRTTVTRARLSGPLCGTRGWVRVQALPPAEKRHGGGWAAAGSSLWTLYAHGGPIIEWAGAPGRRQWWLRASQLAHSIIHQDVGKERDKNRLPRSWRQAPEPLPLTRRGRQETGQRLGQDQGL